MKDQYEPFGRDFGRTRRHAWPEFEHIRSFVRPGMKVLDVGCGNGRLCGALCPEIIKEEDYTGTDGAAVMVDQAREAYPEATWVEADFTEKWPFADESFDAVVGVASFHHVLTRAGQRTWMAEAARVLRPGGILWVSTWKMPSKHRWPNWVHGRFCVWNVPFGKERHPRWYRWVRPGRLKRLLRGAKLRVIDTHLSRGRNWVAVGKKG